MVERAIQTFKAHFISFPPDFPAKEWDRFLPQCELTLNLLQLCRYNPKLSAYSALEGCFNFNTIPLALFGTKCLIHEKQANRATWAPCGTDACYIGPAMHHYHYVNCFIPATNKTCITNTVQYFPHGVLFPAITTEDLLRNASQDILALLNAPQPAAPCLSMGDSTCDTIK